MKTERGRKDVKVMSVARPVSMAPVQQQDFWKLAGCIELLDGGRRWMD